MQSAVILQSISRQKPLPTFHTAERLVIVGCPCMYPIMISNSALRFELFPTNSADERMEPGVMADVRHEASLLFEQSTALRTTVAFLLRVGSEVRRQSTGVDVEATADWTTVILHSGVT